MRRGERAGHHGRRGGLADAVDRLAAHARRRRASRTFWPADARAGLPRRRCDVVPGDHARRRRCRHVRRSMPRSLASLRTGGWPAARSLAAARRAAAAAAHAAAEPQGAGRDAVAAGAVGRGRGRGRGRRGEPPPGARAVADQRRDPAVRARLADRARSRVAAGVRGGRQRCRRRRPVGVDGDDRRADLDVAPVRPAAPAPCRRTATAAPPPPSPSRSPPSLWLTVTVSPDRDPPAQDLGLGQPLADVGQPELAPASAALTTPAPGRRRRAPCPGPAGTRPPPPRRVGGVEAGHPEHRRLQRVEASSCTRAAMSAVIDDSRGASDTTTSRPVRRTDVEHRVEVSGDSVRRSMTSRSCPSASAARRGVEQVAHHRPVGGQHGASVPRRSTRAVCSGGGVGRRSRPSPSTAASARRRSPGRRRRWPAAACRSASDGFAQATTRSPAMCAKNDSGLSLWCSTAPIPPPNGIRITIGIRPAPGCGSAASRPGR